MIFQTMVRKTQSTLDSIHIFTIAIVVVGHETIIITLFENVMVVCGFRSQDVQSHSPHFHANLRNSKKVVFHNMCNLATQKNAH